MQRWPIALGDGVLLAVALAGAVLMLVRARRAGGRAVTLAGTACGVLVLAMVFDLVWWLVMERDDSAGLLVTRVLTAAGVGLLIGAALAATAATRPATQPTTQPAAGRPAGPGQPVNGAAPVPPYQPAGGWTPPQQASPNDWNVQSGVWSIPRGTFDGPPPEQR